MTKKYGTGMLMPSINEGSVRAIIDMSKEIVKLSIKQLIETGELKKGDRLDVRVWVTPSRSN